ncbi:MAG: CBS domain-containing protein [Bacteroidia bacterium]|nr:CBS domain-containing protein [Bacteroidia bacterium]
MGELNVSLFQDAKVKQGFIRSLLNDVKALEKMLAEGVFENDITRIGAEQEMCIVYRETLKPAPLAIQLLELLKEYPWVETELAQFNLEINLNPHKLAGACFSELYNETREKIEIIRDHAEKLDTDIILTGILPTLRKFHLDLDYLTPKKRYKALMDAISSQLQGNQFELRLLGVDELLVKHDSPLMEASNTSFQVHLQVAPEDFVKKYNIAQAIAGPVLGIAANSPIVYGKRLWHESRIALFQQSIDTRKSHNYMREWSPRVNFGNDWLKNSLLEIYKEDIARFRVLIASDIQENSLDILKSGEIPKLRALQVHNGTVYRWNRPCYGISPNGKPHLRIENRVLPAGPTIQDEVANAAFWIGLVEGLSDQYEDITQHIAFEDVRDNFVKAAKYGIDSTFSWLDDRKVSMSNLVLDELIPLAKQGLRKYNIDEKDIQRYISIIEGRAQSHMNGARWNLRAYTKLIKSTTRDEAVTVLTNAIIENQKKEMPGHTWDLPQTKDLGAYRPGKLLVEEFMNTDLFTAREEDIIEFVADLMKWRNIRHMPVENDEGKLVGLITSDQIMEYHRMDPKEREGITVVDMMIKDPFTIPPMDTLQNAFKLMQEKEIGCLPVAFQDELAGIITEQDILKISSRLL